MPDFGDGSSRDDYGALDSFAPSVGNGQISAEAYAEYQRKRKRDAIFGVITTLGGMLGAQPLANAMGIGASAGGALASGGTASVPGAVGASSAPLGGGTVVASGAPGAAAGAAGAGAAGAGAAAAGGAKAAGFLGMNPMQLASLGLAGAGAVGGALSNNSGALAPNTATSDPQLQKLIQSMQGRLDMSEPLYKSIMAMANGRLPTQYQNGGAGK